MCIRLTSLLGRFLLQIMQQNNISDVVSTSSDEYEEPKTYSLRPRKTINYSED